MRKILYPYVFIRDYLVDRSLDTLSESDRFTLIYKKSYWKGLGEGSLSGAGSNLDSTDNIRRSLPVVLDKCSINSMLDVPCGDWFWMRHVDLSNVQYTGGDIVDEIVKHNNTKYSDLNVNFYKIDLINDRLKKVDLMFVRDCLVHLTDEQINDALMNIIKSGSKYFMATTFPETAINNKSTLKDRWRPINLELPPFSLPKPIYLIDDSWCGNSIDANKKMGVWKLSDLTTVGD